MRNDKFANIAAAGISSEGKGLITPEPPFLAEKYIELTEIDESGLFTPEKKIETAGELYREVERQKAYYKPFFSDHAPVLEEKRKRTFLNEFQWRIGTSEDLRDFAGVLEGRGKWGEIMIPHYGEPRGVAVTYYRKELVLDKVSEEESLWIVFKGVDYKAHVYFNGRYIGSHEGFFAPFEFELSQSVLEGKNVLLVAVENDHIHMGSVSKRGGAEYTGDKFYAATGPGYDEPYEGWHHCPPAMGIYQDVYIERRSKLFLQDIFVRPLPKQEMAEVWLEIYDCQAEHRRICVDLSVYGQNFKQTIIEHMRYEPQSSLQVGMGDSLTEAKMLAEGKLGKGIPLFIERGINYLKIPVSMENFRTWDPDTPWLYQAQIRLLDAEGQFCFDSGKRQFGMRDFVLDEKSRPKGEFWLNNRRIRLRGANTMGFEQQCIMKKDWEQLYTDLILARVCRMNFLRITQRPVQEELYDYCDKIGLLIQTDFPAFGAIRRNQFAEGIRQAQEMEHLVRSHPCVHMVTYINEPMPNAKNMPHRCLERQELENFFNCADIAVKLLNPDRVIKHVDGDYDPPTEGFPDNHCYPCWYNGHGIDIGRLHRGYWMSVKPGWHYGCGEYGIEGLDSLEVMKKYYPPEWLPQNDEEEKTWTPCRIPTAQTGNFHYFFYDTKHSLEEWVEESQRYQAEAVKLMTEAYRRDSRMNSFAYHLFIDAFPAGWMKTLMDVERNPKKAYFAYRNALVPVLVSLRTDRFKLFAGEKAKVECWICNDLDEVVKGSTLKYQIYLDNSLVYAGSSMAEIPASESTFQGFVSFEVPEVKSRQGLRLEAGLFDKKGMPVNDASLELEVFPAGTREQPFLEEIEAGSCIMVSSYEEYRQKEAEILQQVDEGAVLLISELPQGKYDITGHEVKVKECSMLPLHFASCATGHKVVEGMLPDAVRYWYDEDAGYITPLLYSTFTAKDCSPILLSGNQDEEGNWEQALAAGEFSYGKGYIRICQVRLEDRLKTNPTARELLKRLCQKTETFEASHAG